MEHTKIIENKQIKRTRLYNAAYDLFTRNGVHNTVIDDIVKHAGVAKGTFYNYCKDKYDLVDKIIVKKSAVIVSDALQAMEERQTSKNMDFQESVICFADYIITYFEKNKKLLELIYKNLSWKLFDELLKSEETAEPKQRFIEHFTSVGGSDAAAMQRLYIIVSMVGSVCYNSVILNTPYSLDEVKPELFRAMKRILQN